jgi:hypothetical protein
MTSYKTVQEFIVHRDRRFHFVSYEGRRADVGRHQEELPACWYLMAAGKRVMVMEQVIGLEQTELHRQLTDWLDRNVFTDDGAPAGVAAPVRQVSLPGGRMRRHRT